MLILDLPNYAVLDACTSIPQPGPRAPRGGVDLRKKAHMFLRERMGLTSCTSREGA